jgi:hypothetical protein
VGEGVVVFCVVTVGVVPPLELPLLQAARENTTQKREQSIIERAR